MPLPKPMRKTTWLLPSKPKPAQPTRMHKTAPNAAKLPKGINRLPKPAKRIKPSGASLRPNACIACSGSGMATSGSRCFPCNGTGVKRDNSTRTN